LRQIQLTVSCLYKVNTVKQNRPLLTHALKSMSAILQSKSDSPPGSEIATLCSPGAQLSPPPRKTPAFKHGDTRGVPFVGLGHRGPTRLHTCKIHSIILV